MAVEPVVYGAADRPPRGDYGRAHADYTCAQNYATYTEADHDTYRRLYERQAALLPGLACDEFIAALPSLGVKDRIPHFDEINALLLPATGWQITADWSGRRAFLASALPTTLCAAIAQLAQQQGWQLQDLQPGLGYDARTASGNFPAPWPGGKWRLADIVDYQLAASWAVLDHAARNREHWLRTFLGVNRRACERRDPYTFVFPAAQADPLASARLLRVNGEGSSRPDAGSSPPSAPDLRQS